MNKSIFLSLVFHAVMIILTAISLPFMMRSPIDLPPILSVDLIQITDNTSIPYAAKASKILEKIKKEEKNRLVSQQAPPSEKKKEKPDRIPMPEDLNKEEKNIVKKKQNPKEVKEQVRQASEFEKEELFDPNQIAALIDKSKEETAETLKESKKLTQDSIKNSFSNALTLSQEDALKAQIFGCWSLPLGLPYQENLLVRIKLKLKPDGTVLKSEILDHARMNQPGQGFYKVLAESALRAIRICQPLRVPPTGYEKWKDLQLNFDANEMLKG
ncbi:cell envelope biogenesis protein TolA [bacterium]|nr:cell envelope biogenesis protein TolA [bacterium]